LCDPDLAEEAVQEAFLRAWQSCATFDPAGGPLLNWLLTITRNVAIDLARARGRRPTQTPPERVTSSARRGADGYGVRRGASLLAEAAQKAAEDAAFPWEWRVRWGDRPARRGDGLVIVGARDGIDDLVIVVVL
jgi:DNA-directed RNA polymerase specialized sigma24 family protein